MMDQVVQDAQKLIRPDIRDMEPYTPILPFEVLSEQLGRSPDQIIKLDANENPYGPSPKALDALARLADVAPIYPDPESRKLRAGLSDYMGVDSAHILVGAGADELIDLVMRLFLNPGDSIINCPPTFGMYPFDAALSGARVINVVRRDDFSLDIDKIEQEAQANDAKLLILCSPNNPDGSLLPPDQLDRLLQLPLVVILDEAYLEFSGAESAGPLVPDTPNLIVLRTFSKWAGLAGLRVGHGVFPLSLMGHLWKIKQPYNLNVAADAAARASLGDLSALRDKINLLVKERERLERELATIPYLKPYPSRSNFVLCRVDELDASLLKKRLAEEYGILIRYFNKPGLRDHIRVSAGKPEHTDILLTALRAIGESSL
jgi:histidinol-phosphate aminotransferase